MTPPSCLTFSLLTKGRTVVDVVEGAQAVAGIGVSADDLTGGTWLHKIEGVDSSVSAALISRTLLVPTDDFAKSPVAISPTHRGADRE